MATAPAFDPRLAPIVFEQTGDFAATRAAEAALARAGFSVGPMQRGSPRGLLLGSWAIAKWRNLSHRERIELHGEMHGGRFGPVIILPSTAADDDMLGAFGLVRAVSHIDPPVFVKLVGGFAADA